MFFLGLDVGTTRCKAALFDEDGHLIAGGLPGIWVYQSSTRVG